MARYGKFTRRYGKSRKPLKRLAKRARYRKGAGAQSRQISKIANHLARLKADVKEDEELHASYRMNLTFRCIPYGETISPPVNRNGIVIVPLTSGPSQVTPSDPSYPTATGNFRTIDTVTGAPTLKFGNCQWHTWVRPRNASQMNWIKLYKQTIKVRFDADIMETPITYQVFLLRAARASHGQTNSDNTLMQLAQRLDGTKFIGNSSLSPDTGFQRNNDYTSSVALTYTPKQGQRLGNVWDTDNTRMDGDPLGAGNDVIWNNNYFEVVSKRKFTLGPQPNPQYTSLPATTSYALATASSQPVNNRMSEEMSFSINYGGAKLSSVDGGGPGAIDQVQDIHYSHINPKLKHWLVICPNVSAPVSNAVCSLNSVISCKVPA